MKKRKRDIRGIATEYLPWIIIAILVLVIVFFAIMKYSQQGTNFIDQIKNLFRRT
jgi:hypothetical protein